MLRQFATLVCSAIPLSLVSPALAAPPTPAHYVGTLIYSPNSDGRHMTLVAPFEFVDTDGTSWPVPKGMMTDGASIPQIFWSVMGGPYEGKYRDAAVIHDYYCDVRIRSWQTVDRMFYDAMIASGVDKTEATLMYAAVVHWGPHWDEQTMVNSKLRADIAGATSGDITMATTTGPSIVVPVTLASEAELIVGPSSNDDHSDMNAAPGASPHATVSAPAGPSSMHTLQYHFAGGFEPPHVTTDIPIPTDRPVAVLANLKPASSPTPADLDKLKSRIQTGNLSLDQIDALYAPK